MTEFVTRVELHGGLKHYPALHKQMRARKFYRGFLQGKVGFRLPPAEYWYRGTSKAAEVLQLAISAVNAMKPPFPPGSDTGPDLDGTSAIWLSKQRFRWGMLV
jgi:hypothetical protein